MANVFEFASSSFADWTRCALIWRSALSTPRINVYPDAARHKHSHFIITKRFSGTANLAHGSTLRCPSVSLASVNESRTSESVAPYIRARRVVDFAVALGQFGLLSRRASSSRSFVYNSPLKYSGRRQRQDWSRKANVHCQKNISIYYA